MCHDYELKQINLLINRLERLSADSIWSHRASGIRGSLLGYLEDYEGRDSKITLKELESLLERGNYVLEQAIKHRLIKQRIK